MRPFATGRHQGERNDTQTFHCVKDIIRSSQTKGTVARRRASIRCRFPPRRRLHEPAATRSGITSQSNVNIAGQYLQTNAAIGYVVIDVEADYAHAALRALKKIQARSNHGCCFRYCVSNTHCMRLLTQQTRAPSIEAVSSSGKFGSRLRATFFHKNLIWRIFKTYPMLTGGKFCRKR